MWKKFKYHLYGASAMLVSGAILLLFITVMIFTEIDAAGGPMLNTVGTVVGKNFVEGWHRPFPPQWLPPEYFLAVKSPEFSGSIPVSGNTYASATDGQTIKITYTIGKWSKSISVVDFEIK